ncbi:MAG TPA: NAD(P)-dependent oxidoreductase [Candidatus Limnocylindrales bacterium]
MRPGRLMRVAITGAGGRLGSALAEALGQAAFAAEILGWDVPEHDLDDPASAERLVGRFRPDVVVHTAAWTNVDDCARDPELAMRRNGTAVGELAEACVRHGAGLVTVSTNEVFDGRRTDGRPYLPEDRPNPANPYGAAKLEGEQAARAAFGASDGEFALAARRPRNQPMGSLPALAIVRTAWLFGPPGNDFPAKIVAAGRRALEQRVSLKLVADEFGTPTYAPDLALAIVALLRAATDSGMGTLAGIHHVVNSGQASRAEWARAVLEMAGVDVQTEDVPMTTWPRPSTPPRWGVLEPTPLPDGSRLRPWQEALAEYLVASSSTGPARAGGANS